MLMLRPDPSTLPGDPAQEAIDIWNRDARSDRKADLLHRMRQDVRNGSLCGIPLSGPYVDAMFALLDRLGWSPSYAELAQAMPHMPDAFGPEDLREVLARLGHASQLLDRRPREISALRLPALLPGPAPHLVEDRGDGPVLVDPVTRAIRPFRSWRRRTLVCFGNTDPVETPGPGSWTAGLLRGLRGTMLWLLGLTFAINSVVLLTSVAIMGIYDLVLPSAAGDTLAAIVVGTALVIGFDIALRRIRARLMGHLAGRIEYMLSTGLLSKVLSLPVERLTSVPAISQVNRLKQFEAIRDNLAGQFAVVAMELPFAILFSLVLMALVGPVGAVPLALVLGLGIVGVVLLPAARARSIAAQNARTSYDELFLDMLTNLPTLRTLGCREAWGERLDRAAVEAARTKGQSVGMGRVIATVSSVTAPVAGGATVAIGTLHVLTGDLSTGALVACMLVVWRIITPVQQALMLLPRLPVLLRLVHQVDTLMALPGEGDTRPGRLTVPPGKPGRIALRQVSFRHAGASQPAVAGLDLEVRQGEFLAVTGASGAGKTTLLELMQGLLVPQAGVVSLEGRNLRQLPLHEVREAVGLVHQEPQFLHGSILQNLRIGAPMATRREIEALMDELGILPVIRALPDGLETRLTETRHSELSRGTRQTLALTRALLRRPRVLLLDEPAQSLDADLDAALVAALSARIGTMTMVMVSHRPSHIALADRNLRLDQGRIAELRNLTKSPGTSP